MQYMLLIYEDERVYGAAKDGPAMMEVVGKHMALVQELGAVRVGGAGLQNTPNATTLRTSATGTKTVHDGPFAETKEQLGGYYLIDVPDLDDAIAVARKIPLHGEGAIEIRPVLNPAQRKTATA